MPFARHWLINPGTIAEAVVVKVAPQERDRPVILTRVSSRMISGTPREQISCSFPTHTIWPTGHRVSVAMPQITRLSPQRAKRTF